MSTSQAKSKKIILFDIDYTLFKTDTFKASNLSEYQLYDEVIPVLEKLGNEYELGVFSEGDIERQKTKLAKTLIDQHFSHDHLHIKIKKIESIEEIFSLYKNREVILIDDKLTILAEISKRYPQVKTIWIKRGPYALSQVELPDFSPYATVENLNQIVDLIF